jgi:hypothetical protein
MGCSVPLITEVHDERLRPLVAVYLDRLRKATTDEDYLQAGRELQRYVVAETMIYPSLTTLPFIQAARTNVKGYEQLNGFKIRFETMWLDKP